MPSFGASIGTAVGTTPGSTWNLTTNAAVPAGGTVVVGLAWFNASATYTVSGGGLTWTMPAAKTDGSQRNTAEAFAPAPSGLASGTVLTFTVAAGSFTNSSAACYSPDTLTLDANGTGGTGTTGTWSGSVTTNDPNTIVFGFGYNDGLGSGSSTPAGGYTEWCDFINGADVNTFSGVYQIVSSAGTYTPGGTWSSGTNPWVVSTISLKAGGGGGGGATAVTPRRAYYAPFKNPALEAKFRRYKPLLQGIPPVVAPTVPDPPFFTTVGGSTPQFVVSSEDWALLCNGVINNSGNYQLTYDNYFATRAAQGYNAIEVTAFSVISYEGGNDGPDYDGVYPFTGNSLNPAGTRNTAWWDRRDYFFSSAAAHGFRVFCNISGTYLNLGEFSASWTNTQWTQWGNHLAAKYPASTHPHVYWLVGDDYFATVESGLDALYAALNSGGATQPKSIQWFQEATSRKSIYDGSTPGTNQWRVNAEFNWGYSYNPWYDVTEKMAVENQTLTPIPSVAADGFFLSTGPTGLTDEQLMRRMVWWAISSGAKGVNTGNNAVYPWSATAYSVVTSNVFYTNVMPAIAAAVNSWPNWHLLEPDMSNQLVTSGRGTRITPIQTGDPQYLSDSDSFVTVSYIKASSHVGELAVIYCSHNSTITIDESKMVAGYTAKRVDPATGVATSITPGSTYNTSTFPNNSDGQRDWVIVLQAPAANTTITVDTAVLTLTGQDVAASGGTATVTVDTATLTLTGQDPAAAGTGTSSVTIDPATITLTGVDITLSSGLVATVDPAILNLTGVTPALDGSGSASVTVDQAVLTLTGQDPAASGTGTATTTLDVATITLTGVDVGASTASGPITVNIDTAILTLSGQDVPLTGTGTTNATVDPGVLTLTGVTPGVDSSVVIPVDTAVLSLSGVTAALTATGTATATIDPAALLLGPQDPALAGSGTTAVVVDVAHLVLNGVDLGAFSGEIVTPPERGYRPPPEDRGRHVPPEDRGAKVRPS